MTTAVAVCRSITVLKVLSTVSRRVPYLTDHGRRWHTREEPIPHPPGQSACSPGMLWPVTSRRHRLEWGWLGEVTYERPPGPLHRLVILLKIWTWGAAHRGLTMSSEDRHRVGNVVAVSPWQLRCKIRPAVYWILPPLHCLCNPLQIPAHFDYNHNITLKTKLFNFLMYFLRCRCYLRLGFPQIPHKSHIGLAQFCALFVIIGTARHA